MSDTVNDPTASDSTTNNPTASDSTTSSTTATQQNPSTTVSDPASSTSNTADTSGGNTDANTAKSQAQDQSQSQGGQGQGQGSKTSAEEDFHTPWHGHPGDSAEREHPKDTSTHVHIEQGSVKAPEFLNDVGKRIEEGKAERKEGAAAAEEGREGGVQE